MKTRKPIPPLILKTALLTAAILLAVVTLGVFGYALALGHRADGAIALSRTWVLPPTGNSQPTPAPGGAAVPARGRAARGAGAATTQTLPGGASRRGAGTSAPASAAGADAADTTATRGGRGRRGARGASSSTSTTLAVNSVNSVHSVDSDHTSNSMSTMIPTAPSSGTLVVIAPGRTARGASTMSTQTLAGARGNTATLVGRRGRSGARGTTASLAAELARAGAASGRAGPGGVMIASASGPRGRGPARGGAGGALPPLSAKMEQLLKSKPIFGAPPQQGPPVVQGVLGDSALINGNWVKIGESQGNFKVLEISAETVVVEIDGQRRDLPVWGPSRGGGPGGPPSSRGSRAGAPPPQQPDAAARGARRGGPATPLPPSLPPGFVMDSSGNITSTGEGPVRVLRGGGRGAMIID